MAGTTTAIMAAGTTTFRSESWPGSGSAAKARRSPRSALALALSLALTSCHKSEPERAFVPPPPPARPSSVLAEVVVPRPGELWQAASALAGPLAALLPRGPELAMGSWLGMPPLSATRLDLRTPVVGAFLAEPEPALVLGVHVANGAELIADLTTGAGATRKLEPAQDLRLLSAVEPGRPLLAVVDDVLLVGPRAALLSAGRYVARGLLRSAKDSGPVSLLVPGAALRERALPLLREAWQQRRAELVRARAETERSQGRPPDFADPEVVLRAVDGALERVASALLASEQVTGELTLSGERLECQLRLRQRAGAPKPEVPAVDTAALARLPANSALALLIARAPGSLTQLRGGLSSLFAERLLDADRKAFEASFAELDAGLGAAQSFALLANKSLVWRGDVADAPKLRQGLGDVLGLLQRKPIAEPLAAFVGRPSVRRAAASTTAPLDAATIVLTPAPLKGAVKAAPTRIELRSKVEPERFVVALQSGAAPPLAEIMAAESGSASLGAAPATHELFAGLEPATLALFVDMAQLGLAPEAPAPMLFELGVREGDAAVTWRASAGSLRALAALEQRQ